MKKIKGIFALTAVLSIMAAAVFTGCTYEGDKIYNIVSSDENNLDSAFSIDTFNKKENVKLYFTSDTTPYSVNGKDLVLTLYFPVSGGKEISDIPYIDVSSAFSTIAGWQFNITRNAGKVTYERKDNVGYTVIFDESKQTVDFLDYDEFIRLKDSATMLDLVSSGSRKYVKSDTSKKTETHGKEIIISLKKYGIPFKIVNGEAVIPFQTLTDLFLCNNAIFVYNQKGLYYTNILGSGYYDSDSGKNNRTDELVKFNYNELCMNCDLFYGLKSEHGISSFDDYFTNTGLIEQLKGFTDDNGNFTAASAQDTVLGIAELVKSYFADYHSSLGKNSYYAGSSYIPEFEKSPTYLNQYELMTSYKTMRSSSLSSGEELHEADVSHRAAGFASVFDYRECSSDGVTADTAVLTFDNFVNHAFSGTDYFALKKSAGTISKSDVNDTMGLVIYANQQIAANENINRVVIDLSCNGGGSIDALMYICSWILGDCTFNLKNSLSGALGSTVYTSDVNLNGTFGEDDDILVKLKKSDGTARSFKIYCITSPMSFSCGNALPALLKQSGKVTIIGKTSGGGACLVRNGCTADTTGFNMSSCYQMCTVKNGTFYQVDQGITPDFAIDDFKATVYNRNALSAYLSNLK